MTPKEKIEKIADEAQHDAHPAGQVSALARAILELIEQIKTGAEDLGNPPADPPQDPPVDPVDPPMV